MTAPSLLATAQISHSIDYSSGACNGGSGLHAVGQVITECEVDGSDSHRRIA
jgi:hypothetical protein